MIFAPPTSPGPRSYAALHCPLLTPLLLILTSCSHPYHSKQFSRPLFSYSYALFCTVSSRIPLLFNMFRTLCPKRRGWGYPSLSLPPFPPSAIIIGLALPPGSRALCPVRTFRTHDAAREHENERKRD